MNSLFFATMVAGLGFTSAGIMPNEGLNAYVEPEIKSEWILKELNLEHWRIIYPLVLAPRQTFQGLYQVYKKKRKIWKQVHDANQAKEKFKTIFAPWDGDATKWSYRAEPTPPCDVPKAFFGGTATIPPPNQDIEFCPLLEDPVHRETPYIWDEKDELICMTAKNGENNPKARFDTDSGTCGIDNRASASMSPHKADFQGPLSEEKRTIRGFEGAKVYTIYKGTLLLPIEDDDGEVDEVAIPNSYYVPSCPYRIIIPQHWAQAVEDPTEDGTGCTTYSDRAILFWKGGTKRKTVPIDKQNVFTFDLPAGYKRFHAMCATCKLDPFQDDENPELIDQPELLCHLFHPTRDDPNNKDPELRDKSHYFFPSQFQ